MTCCHGHALGVRWRVYYGMPVCLRSCFWIIFTSAKCTYWQKWRNSSEDLQCSLYCAQEMVENNNCGSIYFWICPLYPHLVCFESLGFQISYIRTHIHSTHGVVWGVYDVIDLQNWESLSASSHLPEEIRFQGTHTQTCQELLTTFGLRRKEASERERGKWSQIKWATWENLEVFANLYAMDQASCKEENNANGTGLYGHHHLKLFVHIATSSHPFKHRKYDCSDPRTKLLSRAWFIFDYSGWRY